MAPPATIKCKFCNWQTKKWSTGTRGRKVSGFSRLRGHIEEAHPDEAEIIRKIAENNREWAELLAQFGAKPDEGQVEGENDC